MGAIILFAVIAIILLGGENIGLSILALIIAVLLFI